MSVLAENPEARRSGISFEGFRTAIVALIFSTSFFVRYEPALTDLMVVLATLLFLQSGLHLSRFIAAPILILLLYIAMGPICTFQIVSYTPEDSPYQYTLALILVASSAVFLSAYIVAEPQTRLKFILRHYWIGATIGAALALLVYFKIDPVYAFMQAYGGKGIGTDLTRATGGYKDPNVFSTWLVLPFVTMIQAFVTRQIRPGFINLTSFLIIGVALLFAFSRGAWIITVLASAGTIFFTLLLSPSAQQRMQILKIAIIAAFLLVAVVIAIVSIPGTSDIFLDRFTLVKDYDSGETGRFGNQLNSIPMLLQRPLGFGPYQFNPIFGIAPHNTFLNAFAAGGWLGGVFYLTLFVINCIFCARLIFTRSPFQVYAIPVALTLTITTLQGIQIDQEHWRHLYWMMGMCWGLHAALKERAGRPYSQREIVESWGAAATYGNHLSEPAYQTR